MVLLMVFGDFSDGFLDSYGGPSGNGVTIPTTGGV